MGDGWGNAVGNIAVLLYCRAIRHSRYHGRYHGRWGHGGVGWGNGRYGAGRGGERGSIAR